MAPGDCVGPELLCPWGGACARGDPVRGCVKTVVCENSVLGPPKSQPTGPGRDETQTQAGQADTGTGPDGADRRRHRSDTEDQGHKSRERDHRQPPTHRDRTPRKAPTEATALRAPKRPPPKPNQSPLIQPGAYAPMAGWTAEWNWKAKNSSAVICGSARPSSPRRLT